MSFCVDDVDRGHCALCDVTDSLIIDTALPQQQHQYHSAAVRASQWPPRVCDEMTSPRSASPRVADCQSATGSVYYDLVDDGERSSTLYSQIYGDSRPRRSAVRRSPAAVVHVQPYCYLNSVNTAAMSPLYQRPNVRMGTARTSTSVSLPRPSTSTPPHDSYTGQRAVSRTTDGLAGTKPPPPRRKYLSQSCPDIRLVSSQADGQPRRHQAGSIMSTFGKCRPAVQYDCNACTDDCCGVDHADKLFTCDDGGGSGDGGRVYLGRRYVDLFGGGVDAALYPVSDAVALYGDRTRLTSHQTFQSTYGTLQSTEMPSSSSRAARVRAFLSTDASGKQSSVVCETTRLNSAVCKPIITTRHHKVAYLDRFASSAIIYN